MKWRRKWRTNEKIRGVQRLPGRWQDICHDGADPPGQRKIRKSRHDLQRSGQQRPGGQALCRAAGLQRFRTDRQLHLLSAREPGRAAGPAVRRGRLLAGDLRYSRVWRRRAGACVSRLAAGLSGPVRPGSLSGCGGAPDAEFPAERQKPGAVLYPPHPACGSGSDCTEQMRSTERRRAASGTCLSGKRLSPCPGAGRIRPDRAWH